MGVLTHGVSSWHGLLHNTVTSSKYKHLKGGEGEINLSRIVTILRFYPSYKTTGQPVTLSWILVEEHEVSGFETLENLALPAVQSVIHHFHMLISQVLNSIE